MKFSVAVTVPLEIAHAGDDGTPHGHSITLEVWTDREACLDAWRMRVLAGVGFMEGKLEETIGGGRFEDVAIATLSALPDATRVVVRLPTRGHIVEATR